MLKVALFEDAAVAQLYPLSATRPAFELRVGCFNLRERLELATSAHPLTASVRPELTTLTENLVPAADPNAPSLWINARLVGSVEDLRDLLTSSETPGSCVVSDDAVVVAHGTPAEINRWLVDPPAVAMTLPESSGLQLIQYAWELGPLNDALLPADIGVLLDSDAPPRRIFASSVAPSADLATHLASTGFSALSDLPSGVHRCGEHTIGVGPDVTLRPGVVLDASLGPIALAAGSSVAPNAVLQGPLYLGPGSRVNPGAKLREGTSLGAACKVGGEVEESVVLDFSNKQHDGFLGHAVVGSWVNLGADTNASDLKNNYGPVRVDLGEGALDTGSQFVGPLIGDHAKTGINTMLSTGAVLGVSANVFGGGFPPKTLASFVWGGAEALVEYDLERALATARVVMARRDVEFTSAYEDLLRHVFRSTQDVRQRQLRP